jgi:hypothetical protein
VRDNGSLRRAKSSRWNESRRDASNQLSPSIKEQHHLIEVWTIFQNQTGEGIRKIHEIINRKDCRLGCGGIDCRDSGGKSLD